MHSTTASKSGVTTRGLHIIQSSESLVQAEVVTILSISNHQAPGATGPARHSQFPPGQWFWQGESRNRAPWRSPDRVQYRRAPQSIWERREFARRCTKISSGSSALMRGSIAAPSHFDVRLCKPEWLAPRDLDKLDEELAGYSCRGAQARSPPSRPASWAKSTARLFLSHLLSHR